MGTARNDDPRPAFTGQSTTDALVEHRVAGDRALRLGALLDVRRDRVRLPDGSEAVREYIVHPGAVLIIPVLDDGRLVVERQFRYPQNRTFLEFPGGSSTTARRRSYGAARTDRGGRLQRRAPRHAPRRRPSGDLVFDRIEIYLRREDSRTGARSTSASSSRSCAAPRRISTKRSTRELTDAKTVAALTLVFEVDEGARRSIRVRISGVVQGVGYRDWALRCARQAGVAGWAATAATAWSKR